MIRNKLYRKLIGLSDYIEKLFDQDYFNNASIKALECYKAFCDYFIKNFDEIDSAIYDDLYYFISIQLLPEMRYVQRTKTSNIPWSLIPNLDEILKNELGSEYMLLFRPQWKYNYSVNTTDLVEELTQILLTFFPLRNSEIEILFPKNKLHIFSFPYLEKTNVLLDSVIGHEIGHFFQKNWQESPYAIQKITEFNNNLAQNYQNEYPTDLIKPYEMTREGINIINGMYREIISDIFGYKIFGPSLLFSLFDIASFETKLLLPSSKNNYYPLIKYRIRFIYENLTQHDENIIKLFKQNNEASKIATQYLSDIEKYLASRDDMAILAPKHKELSLFESTTKDILDYANTEVSKEYFNTEKTHILFDRLSLNLPINEIDNSPIDMTSILFAGWLRFYKINKDYEKDEYVNNYQILMKLLMKSLYSSFVHTQYQKQRAS